MSVAVSNPQRVSSVEDTHIQKSWAVFRLSWYFVVDEEESEEEKEKKLMKERAKMEYFAAIDEEGE